MQVYGVLLFALILVWGTLCAADETINVCESADPEYLGTYKKSSTNIDGVPIYVNAQEKSFFRNKGFWYLGDLNPWPPETHYRCVELEKCNYKLDFPPSNAEGQWTVAVKHGKEPTPKIFKTACPSDEF